MPELPEVQTIVNDLRRSIRGWKVADFCSLWKKNVSPSEAKFKKEIVGKGVTEVQRKGKYILIELDDGNVIVVHLRMTGALIAQVKSSKLKVKNCKHIRHWWVLRKGKREMKLLFSDVRKFATIGLIINGNIDSIRGLQKLGVDPLGKKFNSRFLTELFRMHPKRTVRSILLDQALIGGIGNIYVSEILFDAKISPIKESAKISKEEAKRLCNSIKTILRKSIALRGTTISDYRDSWGGKGSFQNELKVYNREHEQCPKKGCLGVVLKKKIQQRSAFWCPKCQE